MTPRKPPGGGDDDGNGRVIPIKAEDRKPAPARSRGRVGGHNASPKTILITRRRADALQLRAAGLSYTKIAEAIAEKYQIPSYNRPTAYKDVQVGMDAIIEEPAREAKEAELLRLNQLQAAFWGAAMGADIHAGTMVLRIMAHRAKLLGLESPIKYDVSGTSIDAVTVNLADPSELHLAGLDLLEELRQGERTRAAAAAEKRKANKGG